MNDPVSSIRNLGPAMDAAFAHAGITSAAQLRALGSDAAYAALLAAGLHRAHFMAFCALDLGLQGRPWNDCTPAEKERMRTRFDALRDAHSETGPAGTAQAGQSGTAALDRALAEFGVIAAHPATKDMP